MSFAFHNPTKLLFGSGRLKELGDQQMPGKKAMVLISNGKSTKANGYLDRTQEQLVNAGVETAVFDKIMENPVKDVIMEGAAFARENNCDFIVALGGGAVLDSSVAIAAMATNPGDLWDYVCGGTGKGQPLVNKGLPIVTVATTSGTGSEINCWGVISNLETNEKIGFGSPELVPGLSVVDPELMKKAGSLTPEEFTSPFLGKTYRILQKRWEDGRNISVPALSAELEPAEISRLTVILSRPEALENGERALQDYIEKIKTEKLKKSAEADIMAVREKYREKKGYGG